MINNLSNYRLALKLNKDIDKILDILNPCMSQLEKFKHFSSIKTCLQSMEDAKLLLELHNVNQKSIIKSKGFTE